MNVNPFSYLIEKLKSKADKSDIQISTITKKIDQNSYKAGYYNTFNIPTGYKVISFSVDWTSLADSNATNGVSFYLGHQNNIGFIFCNQQLTTNIDFNIMFIKE